MNDWSFKRWDQPILAIYDIYIYMISNHYLPYHHYIPLFRSGISPEAIPRGNPSGGLGHLRSADGHVPVIGGH